MEPPKLILHVFLLLKYDRHTCCWTVAHKSREFYEKSNGGFSPNLQNLISLLTLKAIILENPWSSLKWKPENQFRNSEIMGEKNPKLWFLILVSQFFRFANMDPTIARNCNPLRSIVDKKRVDGHHVIPVPLASHVSRLNHPCLGLKSPWDPVSMGDDF